MEAKVTVKHSYGDISLSSNLTGKWLESLCRVQTQAMISHLLVNNLTCIQILHCYCFSMEDLKK